MISIATRDALMDRALPSCVLSPASERGMCGVDRPEHGTGVSAFGPFTRGRGYADMPQVQIDSTTVAVNGTSKAVLVDGTSGPRSWSPPV